MNMHMKITIYLFIGLLWLMPLVSFAASIQDTIDLTDNKVVLKSNKFIERERHITINTNTIVFKVQPVYNNEPNGRTRLINDTLMIRNAWTSKDTPKYIPLKLKYDDDSLMLMLQDDSKGKMIDTVIWYIHVRPQIADSCFINLITDSLFINDSTVQYLRWVGVTDTIGKAIDGISERYRWYYYNDTLLLCFEKADTLDASMSITVGDNTWFYYPNTPDDKWYKKAIEHLQKHLPYDVLCLLMLIAIALLIIRLMKFRKDLQKAGNNLKTIIDNTTRLLKDATDKEKKEITNWVEKSNVEAIFDKVVGNKLDEFSNLKQLWDNCIETKEEEGNGTAIVPTENPEDSDIIPDGTASKRIDYFLKAINEKLQSVNDTDTPVDTPKNEVPASTSTKKAPEEVNENSVFEALKSKIAEHPKFKSLDGVAKVDNLDGLLSIIDDNICEEPPLGSSGEKYGFVEDIKEKFKNPTKDIYDWLAKKRFDKVINSYIRKQLESSREFENVWDSINTDGNKDGNKLIDFCKKLSDNKPTDSSQETLKIITEDRDSLFEEKEKWKLENEKLQGLMNEAKRKIAELESKTDANLREEISELKDSINKKDVEITRLTNEKTRLETEKNNVETAFEDAKRNYLDKLNKNEEEKKRIEGIHQKELSDKDEEKENLRKTFEEKERNLNSIIAQKENHISAKNATIGNLESALQNEANKAVETVGCHLANLQDELNKSLSGVDEDSPLHKLVTEQIIDNRRCSLNDTISNIQALKNNKYKTTDTAKSEIRKMFEALLAETDPTWLDVAIRLYSYSLVGFVSQQMAKDGMLLSRIGAAVDPILKDISSLGIELIVPSLFNERFDLSKHEKESLKNITRFADDIGSHVFTGDAVIDLYKVGYRREGKVIEKAILSTYGD